MSKLTCSAHNSKSLLQQPAILQWVNAIHIHPQHCGAELWKRMLCSVHYNDVRKIGTVTNGPSVSMPTNTAMIYSSQNGNVGCGVDSSFGNRNRMWLKHLPAKTFGIVHSVFLGRGNRAQNTHFATSRGTDMYASYTNPKWKRCDLSRLNLGNNLLLIA